MKINNIKTYLGKWLVASLIAPGLIYLTKSSFGGIIIFFWPSSILLMSLGGTPRPTADIIYVWSMAVGINILLYLIIGLIIYYVIKISNRIIENT